MKVFMIVMVLIGSFTVSPTQEVRASLHSQLAIGAGPLPDGYYTESAYVNIHNESGNAMAGMAFRLRFDRDVRISHASIFCQDGVHRNMLQSKVYYSLFDSKMYQISLAPMPPRSSVACHITFRYPIAPHVDRDYIDGDLYHNWVQVQSLGPEQLDGYTHHPRTPVKVAAPV